MRLTTAISGNAESGAKVAMSDCAKNILRLDLERFLWERFSSLKMRDDYGRSVNFRGADGDE